MDEREFEASVATAAQRHKNLLTDYLFQMTGAEKRATELALQAFVRLARNGTIGHADASRLLVKEVTRRIARWELMNRLLNVFIPGTRKRSRRPAFEDGITRGGGVIEWERTAREQIARDALAKVTPKLRCVLVLGDIMAIPPEEAARLAGLSTRHFESRLERGRVAFSAALSVTRED